MNTDPVFRSAPKDGSFRSAPLRSILVPRTMSFSNALDDAHQYSRITLTVSPFDVLDVQKAGARR